MILPFVFGKNITVNQETEGEIFGILWAEMLIIMHLRRLSRFYPDFHSEVNVTPLIMTLIKCVTPIYL